MIWTLKIECISGAYLTHQCVRIIEIDSGSSLIQLHDAIQDAVHFDRDHPFEFFAGRTHRNRQVVFNDTLDWEEAFKTYGQLTLDQVYPLPARFKLYYHFDFGDQWYFEIRKMRKKAVEPAPGVSYPRVIEKQGPDPEQYPTYDQ